MKSSRLKSFSTIFVILLLVGVGYYYRSEIWARWRELLNRFQPCQSPITYSIVDLDSRFGLTKTELLADIKRAEKIWEVPINKTLFQYSATGDLKINLIYDYRQKATDALKKIGLVIGDDRVSYDALKVKRDSLLASYNNEKAQVVALVDAYNTAKTAYEKTVDDWNARGGAPKAEFQILQQQRIDLNNRVVAINQAEDSLNSLVDTVNSTGAILNKLVAKLNLHTATYNTVGASTGKEFNEGEYLSNVGGTSINIYQFNDTNQLVRVLAHELGHTLGIDHLSNPKAIMYYLNEGGNEKLTADDLVALKKMCNVK